MSFLLERDGLNGKSGKAFATIDGRNVELFGLKKLEANAEFNKADFPVVGTKTVQQKLTSMKITGSFTIYYGTPEFIKLAHEYQKTGKMPPISLQVTNDDQATSVGVQTVAYYGVNLDKVPLSKLDDSADFLEEEIGFTAASFEPLRHFNGPASLGG